MFTVSKFFTPYVSDSTKKYPDLAYSKWTCVAVGCTGGAPLPGVHPPDAFDPSAVRQNDYAGSTAADRLMVIGRCGHPSNAFGLCRFSRFIRVAGRVFQ